MSRHSHWAKIKRGKGSADAQRASTFTKLARLITVAAREGGGDADFNFTLRVVVDRAKASAMPKDAIERAIERGVGGAGGVILETVLYEGFAPGGAAVLVECVTDNRNRALGEVKSVFTKQGGTLGGEGSVRWQFERRGAATVEGIISEAAELALIDSGAEDVQREDGRAIVLGKPEDLQQLRTGVAAAGLTVADAGFAWIPKQRVEVAEADRARFEAFLGALDDLDDVQEVYTNAVGY